MFHAGPVVTLTGTSPNSASTAIMATSDPTAVDFSRADAIRIYADLVGATGGSLDLYLYHKVQTDFWPEFVHLVTLASGASAIRYMGNQVSLTTQAANVAVGKGTDASAGTQALASGGFNFGPIGSTIRLVAVAGSGTTAGALVNVYIVPYYQV